MAVITGPTSNLPGYRRRAGRSGTVYEGAEMQGEVVGLEWNVAIEQIPVVIAGKWSTATKPGGEERAGTFRFQDLHDKWALRIWRFVRARRNGDPGTAQMPVFDLITKLSDIGSPGVTRWQLDDCMLFEYSGGFSADDQLLMREVPFTFEDESPLDSFEWKPGSTEPSIYSGALQALNGA